MNKNELALALIRAPWAKRLSDRSFLLAVGAACLGVYLFQQKAISGNDLVSLLQWTVGPWIIAEKGKDALLGNAALSAVDSPDATGGAPSLEAAKADEKELAA